MELLISIIGIFITIFFVAGIHEFAHFKAARLMKIKVLTFSIGFGKTIIQKVDRHGTEFKFAWIPLGGYVRMLDETEGPVNAEDTPFAFNRQPLYKKAFVVMAGPLSNIAAALILYWLFFAIGFTSILPVIGNVTPDSIAQKANLSSMQAIVQVDDHPVQSWMRVVMIALNHYGEDEMLKIQVKSLNTNQLSTHLLDTSSWKMNELTPSPLDSLGINPYIPEPPLIIDRIIKDSPAAQSGLKIGDKILNINQKSPSGWEELYKLIQTSPNQSLAVQIKRYGKTLSLNIKIGEKSHGFFSKKVGFLGIGPAPITPPAFMIKHIQYSPLSALYHGFLELEHMVQFNLSLFYKMLSGKLSVQSLGGPITVFETAGVALNAGILNFLSFLAFLNISVGIVNLIPIPGLDGGHLLLYFIEKIRGKAFNPKTLIFIQQCGLFILLFLIIQTLFNDLFRLML